MANEVTFTPEALQQVIAEAVAVALAARDAKPPANKLVDGKTEQQLRIDVLVCKAFKRAGFGDVKPREDVMTYNRWMANGFKVKAGEKSVKVKQFRLFHKSQVEFVGQPDKAEQRAEGEAAVANVAQAATPAKTATAPSIMQRLKVKASAQTSLPV